MWIKGLTVLAAASVVAAIRLPDLVESRRSGDRAAAIGALRTVHTVQDLVRKQCRSPVGAERMFSTNQAGVVFYEPSGVHRQSTFGLDVDTASYGHVRAWLQSGSLPPLDQVRLEELVNAFSYADPAPTGEEPLAVHAEVASCPWAPERRLVRVGVQARELDPSARPACNLVFLIDVSGSMGAPDRLPLVKRGLHLLADGLDARDRVAIVVYAGASGLVLPPTPGDRRSEILSAVDRLRAEGATHGAAGIHLAYRVAAEGRLAEGVNRVILLSDGDFNVGVRDRAELERLAARKAAGGVFLSVLGFGRTQHDAGLEALADHGDGHYVHVDSEAAARKVFVEELTGTLVTVAKDVKVQVTTDPERVASYRLLGYANRRLTAAAFTDDRHDAGDVGAGHHVTAFYELTPLPGSEGQALLDVALRYKLPNARRSRALERSLVVRDDAVPLREASSDYRFGAAVAAFAMILTGEGPADYGLEDVERLAAGAVGADPDGQRAEFLGVVRLARELFTRRPVSGVDRVGLPLAVDSGRVGQ